MITFKVHTVLGATRPFSEYILTRTEDAAIEPLVVHYFYVITEVNLEKKTLKLSSYYISSDYYVYSDFRNIEKSFDEIINRIKFGELFLKN